MSTFIKLIQNKINKEIQLNGKLYTFINPNSYLVLRKEDCLSKIDAVYIDSIYFVKYLQLLGIVKTNRCSFDMTSCASKVFNEASEKSQSVYFVGSAAGVIKNAVNNIKQNFPNLNILGHRNGYFKNIFERDSFLDELVGLNPNVVIAGLGAPLQEKFLIDLRTKGWNGTGFTCGGFFHQTAKKLNYYPDWINRAHLRWLYRIYDEPKLLKRYFVHYPISFLTVIKDALI
jgi:exopolysaccharide biosynthesis WecB/TagA/CpsF family protein